MPPTGKTISKGSLHLFDEVLPAGSPGDVEFEDWVGIAGDVVYEPIVVDDPSVLVGVSEDVDVSIIVERLDGAELADDSDVKIAAVDLPLADGETAGEVDDV